ncbi:carbon-monoxide dehydrogenase large subunit [Acidiphilium rubrum]|uniref:Carbon-monoxide dehydrogenase large subunit n=2 Tax=Acidocellaceae TaxID=3385905 RepID=A0A8G2CP04_ACIRU|nr:carbon-monoxide dehydrogenase large subunit [Acidiphilium rubrum]
MDRSMLNHRPTQSERDRTRWVTGAGRYTADIAVPDALSATFLRSPHAHAEIVSIDIGAALAMPGVIAVLTGADCADAGFGNFRGLMRYGADGPHPLIVPFRPVLAHQRVRHVGEAVACVIATSESAALDASEAIAVTYRDLPAVIGIDAAGKADAPAVHPQAPGNLAFAHQAGDAAAVRAAFDAAETIVATAFDLPRLAPTTMELRGIIARYDEAAGIYHLITPHQGINEIRADLAAVLNVPEARISIELPDVGGGFGARSPAYPEHAALLLAARRTGRAVRWVASRSESFLTDYYGRSTRLAGRLALDAAGRFTGLEITYETDLGAYITTVGAFVNVHNPLMSGSGTYGISAIAANFRQYFTNTGPIGPYRGAGRPDVALLIERLVDRAATALGADPLELRRLNAIPRTAFPYRTALGSTYDSADYAALIDAAHQASDWDGFAARRTEAQVRGRLRGRGVALFTEIAGGGAATRDEARVVLGVTGGRATARIETVTGGSGQSQAETYAFILAERLGMDPADIELAASPAHSTLNGGGSIGSRSTLSAGSAIADAGDQLRRHLLAAAGLRANAPPAELIMAGGAICRPDGSVVLTLAEAIAAADAPLDVVGAVPVSSSFPSGCHVAEVEIDPQTGLAVLVSYVAIDDSGVVLNPIVAEGQIHGGIVQGLGEVFGEAMQYDETGQVLTGSFMDYTMPRAADVPNFVTEDRPTASPNNPLGVKGLGEAGTTGALAAAANAFADALAMVGAELPAFPCTAHSIWRSIRTAGSA